MKHVLLLITTAVLIGCGGHSKPLVAEPKETDPEHWLPAMEIWKCDDGTFDVRTTYTLKDKCSTFDEAEKVRLAWAQEMVELAKKGQLGSQLKELPNCGRKVVP